MLIRTPEAHSRSLVKAVTWRIVGSLDTFVISWVVTGQLKYAGIILGVETFTKVAIYYAHEQFWAWVPWWKPATDANAAAAGPASAQANS
ncbi:MAG TPA: DUF2061 domain-containing protein [Caulobacteraceae bacterium]|jgi:uncharacterized membrane protein